MLGQMTARVRVAASSLIVIALTACGGGGGGSSALPATSTGAQTSLPLTIISQSGNNIEVTGTVNGSIAGGFRLQGGAGVGYVHVLVNSATVIKGPAPFAGENVDVVGTGSPSTSITATTVSQLSTTAVATASPSTTPAPAATPTPIVSATATPAPVVAAGPPLTLPGGVITATGSIGSITGGIIQVQTGPGCGWMKMTTNSATAYFNGTPQVGQYIVVTGTGTKCTSITSANAVSVASSAFTMSTTTGTVAAQTSYGFTLSTGSANVPVALNAATVVFGSTLVVGSQVTVTGYGTTATGMHATQIAVAAPATPTPNPAVPTPAPTATPGPIAQIHVKNFVYLYGYAGTPNTITIAQAQPWVDWTITDQAHESAVRAAGIKTQVYANFWRNYSTDNPIVGYTDLAPGGAHATAEAMDCSSAPVTDPNYGGGYEADPRTSSALGHAQVVTNARLTSYSNNYDALFSDDTGTVEGITTPCGYVQSTWDQAVNAVHTALGVPMFINALGQQNPVQATDMLQPSNVLGAMCELCYSRNGGPNGDFVQTGNAWVNNEDAEINTVAMKKIFWDYGRATGTASSETAIRLYTYASFLLTYDPNYTMFQEALSTPSGFPVMPETAFVPMNPVSTATDVSQYQGPGGAYFREFSDCYYQGSFVNKCAIAINAGTGTEPVPSTSYSHSMVLSGSGVLDGGTVSFDGPGVSSLAPGTAVILFP